MFQFRGTAGEMIVTQRRWCWWFQIWIIDSGIGQWCQCRNHRPYIKTKTGFTRNVLDHRLGGCIAPTLLQFGRSTGEIIPQWFQIWIQYRSGGVHNNNNGGGGDHGCEIETRAGGLTFHRRLGRGKTNTRFQLGRTTDQVICGRQWCITLWRWWRQQ